MTRRRAGLAVFALAATLVLAGAATVAFWSDGMSDNPRPWPTAAGAIPLAVLGDSNSHSYQDEITFPAASGVHGGPYHAHSFQWTEVLARLRARELDLGPWVRWGRPGVVARARELIGLDGGRAPKKEDYLYNFANSGASCKNLTGGRFAQAPRLVALMNREPERWQHGVVVIRIGLNDWGGLLDVQARDPEAPEVRAAQDFCTARIREGMAMIRDAHPQTRIVLVGIGNEADDPANFEHWRSAEATANIRSALADFNGALRKLAVATPRTAFFDDVEWFERQWGARGPNGEPDYRTVRLGEVIAVTNTIGDAPQNALMADRHPGLVWNALWAQALVQRLREAFELPLTPIDDAELQRFVAAQLPQR